MPKKVKKKAGNSMGRMDETEEVFPGADNVVEPLD
jgi:hypothetical protein